MERLLDFSLPLDVPLLDSVSDTMLTGSGAAQAEAQAVLTQFQEHPDAWQRVPEILEQSTNPQARFVALQVMDTLIRRRWRVISSDERIGIRNWVINTILTSASTNAQKSFLNKLNLLLVEILKQEWPHNWPDFIPEIVSSSQTSLAVCENNMAILRLLSEEIFDFSSDAITTSKTKLLKARICQEFSSVFTLCVEILEKSATPSLTHATLEAMLRFLSWIPLGYIFETHVIDLLVGRFLDQPQFRNTALKCLSEIAALSVDPAYNPKFVVLFALVMDRVNAILPLGQDANFLTEIYANADDAEQEFILNLALFLSNFLAHHGTLLENADNEAVLLNAHWFLIGISQVDEREIFKICLEYWSRLVSALYHQSSAFPTLRLGGPTYYSDILSQLRRVIVEHMAKPEEVLIVENDEGEIVREFLRESDTIVLYKSMKEILVYLTHLDAADTETIMTEKLARQVDGSEWSWANLNTLCWAIGSISGAMSEDAEKRFLVTVIKDLLGLTEQKRGKDNKAVVASNIMYIVGQYPRFLKAHWKFLKTVVNKLFEFMHETHEGVQDMACDTFIKIAQKCRRHFVLTQHTETEPFVEEILRTLDSITSDLAPQQVHTFYEAVGYMVSAQPNRIAQEDLLAKLMARTNAVWDGIMADARAGAQVLHADDTIKTLGDILKTNVSACVAIGSFFYPQLARIYIDALGLYQAVSAIINSTTAELGPVATATPKVRHLRTIKKEILKLVGETYIRRAEDLPQVYATLIPPLLEATLLDYKENIPGARDAEVLSCMVTVVTRLGTLLNEQIPAVLDAIFECTLEMINQDFTEYPEHRAAFYRLLRALVAHNFDALLALDARMFNLLIESVLWGMKHPTRDISDLGLQIVLDLMDHIVQTGADIANAFFQTYYLSLLQEILFVLTDSDHKAGFKNQANVLARLVKYVQLGEINVALYPPEAGFTTNGDFVNDFCGNLLSQQFPHLKTGQISALITHLNTTYGNPIQFKIGLRDFLIELREFKGEETSELFLEENEERAAEQQAAELLRARQVPGLIKPSEEDEDSTVMAE